MDVASGNLKEMNTLYVYASSQGASPAPEEKKEAPARLGMGL